MSSFDLITDDNRLNMQEFLARMQVMYATGDVNHIAPICTESLTAHYATELEILRSFGLKKKITLGKHEYLDKSNTENNQFLETADGKNNQSFSSRAVSYTEEYTDEAGKRVKRFHFKSADIVMRTAKLRDQLTLNRPKQIQCKNCGATIQIQGTESKCPYCSAEYHSEAYSWIVSSFRWWSDDLQSGFISLVKWAGGTAIILAVVAEILKLYRPGQAGIAENFWVASIACLSLIGIALGVTLAAGFFVLFMLLARYLRLKRIQSRDPLFSKQNFDALAYRVLSQYPELLGQKAKEDEVIFNGGVYDSYLKHVSSDANYEYVSMRVSCHVYHFTRKGHNPDIRMEKQKVTIPMRRLLSAKTPVFYEPTQYTCQHCGAHQSLQRREIQSCKYCGYEDHLEAIDWALAEHKI